LLLLLADLRGEPPPKAVGGAAPRGGRLRDRSVAEGGRGERHAPRAVGGIDSTPHWGVTFWGRGSRAEGVGEPRRGALLWAPEN